MTSFSIAGNLHPASKPAPGLYVVATPIGNLGDITLRALQILAGCDLVLCEDKRVSKGLLVHFGISTALMSYHEHNAEAKRPEILARLGKGEAIALISDAGTPLISDPGYRLVEAALEHGLSVVPVPGPSALLAALVAAGLPTDRFFFEGFLPAKSAERRRRLRVLEGVPGTLVFYEAPHRIVETLADCSAVFGDRQAAVARELTKRFETVRRGSLAALADAFSGEAPPRGEIVLLVAPPSGESEVLSDDLIDAELGALMATLSAKDAAAVVAAKLGLPKRQVYARAITLMPRRTPES